MLEDWEEINLKISRQFKLLELDEKETEGLITINKRSEIEKHLQHVQLKLEKLQEFESARSGRRQLLVTASPLKIMKNSFYFILKALLVLKIFNIRNQC